MERLVEDSALTRQSRRERRKTPKAFVTRKDKAAEKSVDGNLFGALSQRSSTAKDWDESNEIDTDKVEVRDEPPDRRDRNHTRRRARQYLVQRLEAIRGQKRWRATLYEDRGVKWRDYRA
jgi:hypothetical protein